MNASEPTAICAECRWVYPTHLVTPGHIDGEDFPLCGICALAVINALHNTHRTTFQSAGAEKLRQAAVTWRTTHPGT